MNFLSARTRFVIVILSAGAIFVAGWTPIRAACCKCTASTGSASTICLTTDGTCATIQTDAKNEKLKDVSCESTALSDAQCKKIAEGGQCQEITPATTYGAAATKEKTKIKGIVPNLNVKIPGLTFSSDVVSENGFIEIPYLAQYISALYRYLLGIVLLAAAVMVVYGGCKYILGQTAESIQGGKEIITDAIIGLGLVLGAVLIFRTFNPALVELRPIKLQVILREDLQIVPAGQILAMTGKAPLQAREMKKLVAQKANTAGGINFACFALGSMTHESGGRPDVIGHDENARILTFVPARHDFLDSLRKFSGGKIDLPEQCCIKTKTGEECKLVPQACREGQCETTIQARYFQKREMNFPTYVKLPLACQTLMIANDDKKIDLTKPPDYGLDWRFSHGIGAGQSTIFPWGGSCPGKVDMGRGFWTGGKCYTIPDLFMPETQADVMLTHYKTCWEKAKSNAEAAYRCYGSATPELLDPRMKTYNECVTSSDPVAFASG